MYRAITIFSISMLLLVSCTRTLIATGWGDKGLSEIIECNGVRYSPSSLIYFNNNARKHSEAEIKTYRIHAYDASNEGAGKEICPRISINGLEQKFWSFMQNQCSYSLMDYSSLGHEVEFDIAIKGCPKKSYQLREYRSEQKASFFPT